MRSTSSQHKPAPNKVEEAHTQAWGGSENHVGIGDEVVQRHATNSTGLELIVRCGGFRHTAPLANVCWMSQRKW